MKILIPTIGSRGDVQPFIALAQGLIKAGHQPTLATHPQMRIMVESYGIHVQPIGPDINLAERVALIRQQARNTVVGLMRGMQFGFEMLEKSHEDILALARKADLVIVPTAVAAGKNESELLGLPYLSVSLMPWAIPWDDLARPFFTRIAYRVINGLVHLITTRPLNKIRKKLGLPPVGKEGFTSPRLNLIPVSPLVHEPNPLWEAHHHAVGFWYAQAPAAWAPEAGLLDFLENGEPPVLVSLGAMSLGDQDAFETAAMFVNAVEQAGLRAVIQGWDAGIKDLSLPPGIYPAGPMPHSWLLPHCMGIVHHGGYGTTAAGLQAGIPSLVIPHIADQFYWGQRVFELGVGPKAIKRTNLNTDKLTTALEELTQNKNLRNSAEKLGESIRSENGVEKAVELIDETFG